MRNGSELKVLEEKIRSLEDVLHDIAILADGHRRSTLYSDGSSVALVSVLSLACAAIGKTGDLRRDGTILAPVGTVVEEIDGRLVRRIVDTCALPHDD